MAMLEPSAASALATALPRPLDAAATIATLPFNPKFMSLEVA